MQLNNTTKMALMFNQIAREKLGNKVSHFSIFNVNDDKNHRQFSITFEAYNYFIIRVNYDNGRFGCCILQGNGFIGLKNSQMWWETADFDIFFSELDEELKIRIPDKFLIANNWM